MFPLDTTTLGRAAAVVRHRRDVRNAGDLDPQGIQGAHGGLAAGAGALDADFQRLDAVFLGHAAGGFGSHLGGERRRLARALEAGAAGRGPRQGVALTVGDGDDGVVEGRVDVSNPVGHVLLDFLADARGAALSFRHVLSSGYFFRDAAARRGPLRVRALVRVRWPRTGRPRLWRMPRYVPRSIRRLIDSCTSRRRSPSIV